METEQKSRHLHGRREPSLFALLLCPRSKARGVGGCRRIRIFMRQEQLRNTHQIGRKTNWEEVLIGGNVRSDLDRGQSQIKSYCSFAYSALASFRMGTAGSASFQSRKKSWYALFALAVSPAIA